MRQKRRVAAVLLALLCLLPAPSAAAGEPGGLRIPILMYHHIEQTESYNTMTVSPGRFREDMVFLAENGFTPLLPADLASIAAGEAPMPARPVMITFDDGYESNYIHMYPILQETGMKATVSLIAMLVRTEETGAAWAMTWEQAREMYESGLVDFGSHTWNLHNPGSSLNYVRGGVNGIERQVNEVRGNYVYRVGEDLRKSVKAIETNVGNTVRLFAYPFGCDDSWMHPLLEGQGLSLAVTTGPGLANLSGNLLTLPRFRVDMSAPLSEAGYMKPYLEAEPEVEHAAALEPYLAPIRRLLQDFGALLLRDSAELVD